MVENKHYLGSRYLSYIEIEKFNVSQLKEYLRHHNQNVTGKNVSWAKIVQYRQYRVFLIDLKSVYYRFITKYLIGAFLFVILFNLYYGSIFFWYYSSTL